MHLGSRECEATLGDTWSVSGGSTRSARWRKPHRPDFDIVSATQLRAHIVELLGIDTHAFDIAALAARTYRRTRDAFTRP